MTLINTVNKSLIALVCAVIAATVDAGGMDQPTAQPACFTSESLAAAVDPEPRLAVAGKPFILDFAGLVFMRDGTVQRFQEIEPFELVWNGGKAGGQVTGGVPSLRLSQMRLIDVRESTVELTTKDDSVSIVSAVEQAVGGGRRTLADVLAGITCRVKRFDRAREAYEQHWEFTAWRDIDTVMFVGTPGVKRCPVDDRRFPGFYHFSPYTGSELVWEGQEPRWPSSVACSGCLESAARFRSLCESCGEVEKAARELPTPIHPKQAQSLPKATMRAGGYAGTK